MEHVEDRAAIRDLGKKDMYRLLRWGPMAAADLVAEYFETELLRAWLQHAEFSAPSSARGQREAVWCFCFAQRLIRIRQAPRWFAEGGMGAVTQAMTAAAKQAGAEIRSGVEVIEMRVKDGAATSVVLSTGEEISATAIVSNADPNALCSSWSIPHIYRLIL